MDSRDEFADLPAIIPVESLEIKYYVCHTVQQFQSYLRKTIEPNAMALMPERVASVFYLEPDASFRISLLEQDWRRDNREISEVSAMAVLVDAREDSALGSQAD